MSARLQPWLTLCVLVVSALTTVSANADWVSVKDLAGGDGICLESAGRRFDYVALDGGQVTSGVIHGPRRVKLIARYLFTDRDDDRIPYTVIVALDGREVLRKTFTGRPHPDARPCDRDDRVGSLRRAYLDLAAGKQKLSVRVEHEGTGRVAVRVFREVKRQRQRWVTFAPERYDSVRQLQFTSGNQSTYYHFNATTPLCVTVTGPTTLRVGTRLDFEHTMNGSQTYALNVAIDGEVWRSFHFDTEKLSTAVYVDRPDILPGSRNEFRITVPRGRHAIEIRCARPESCGVAAMIHIPKSDLER
jgi:hypothetical protein